MNEDERQYTDRIEYREVSGYGTESLSYVLPKWIVNLKNYFEKDTIRNNTYSHS